MQRWLSRLLPFFGLLLIALSLTSVLQPAPPARVPDTGLILRQVAHEYLKARGDSSSTIPPVEELPGGEFLLPLECYLDYDELADVTRAVLRKQKVRREYELRLIDVGTGEVFLGGRWPDPLLVELGINTDVACVGRDQDARLANIHLAIAPPAPAKNDAPTYWLLAAGSIFLFLGVMQRKRMVELSEVELPVSGFETSFAGGEEIALGAAVRFRPEAQQLVVDGNEQSLTFREAKLLRFLTDHPNIVLERQSIHDAVWGDEGVMVGRSLDVFISRLRKKLIKAEDVEIQTIHGVGYRFRCPQA